MIKDYLKSFLAGVCIAIGCRVYLCCDNKYVGATLFSIGLIAILLFEFNLYTGKVCYIPDNGLKFTQTVAFILAGNIVGCICVGLMFPSEIAQVMCENKLQLSPINIFFRAIMCNILIYIAVDSYKEYRKLLPTILCIPTFILSGYEHSIADVAYFTMAKIFNTHVVLFITIVVIGNAVGGLLIPCCKLIYNKTK